MAATSEEARIRPSGRKAKGRVLDFPLWSLKRHLVVWPIAKFQFPLGRGDALAWLLLGNILHFCLLWFSGKSQLNC